MTSICSRGGTPCQQSGSRPADGDCADRRMLWRPADGRCKLPSTRWRCSRSSASVASAVHPAIFGNMWRSPASCRRFRARAWSRPISSSCGDRADKVGSRRALFAFVGLLTGRAKIDPILEVVGGLAVGAWWRWRWRVANGCFRSATWSLLTLILLVQPVWDWHVERGDTGSARRRAACASTAGVLLPTGLALRILAGERCVRCRDAYDMAAADGRRRWWCRFHG